MNFNTLDITNFLSISKAKVSLNNRGLISIQGKNLCDSSADSNGTGKSSIPDALCWVWYGVTARDVTGDDVVNEVLKKDTCVISEVEDDGTWYRATRYRKHKTGKNRLVIETKQGKKWKDLTKGTDKLTQQLAESILGCTHDVFKAAIYAGQEDMPDLPAMTDKYLKLLIEEASGLNLLQAASTVARQKLSHAINDRDAAVYAHTSAEQAIDRSAQESASMESEYKSWASSQQLKIEAKTNEAKAAAANQKSQTPVDESKIQTHESKIAELQAQIDGLKSEEDQRTKLSANYSGLMHTQRQLEADERRLTNEAKQIKADIDSIESRIGLPCSECGKPTELSDVSALRAAKFSAAQSKVADLQRCKQALAKVTADAQDALQRANDYILTMTDVTSVLVAQEQSRAVIADLKAKLQAQRAAIESVKHLVEEVKILRQESNPFETMLESKKAAHLELVKAGQVAKKKMQDVEASVEVFSNAQEIFGAGGIRAHILDTVTPFLNQRTAHYLGHLSDGNITAQWSTLGRTAKGEIREKFNIDVINGMGAKKFKGCSGGEKRKVRVATALALQDLVSSRASKPINLFMADEVDDAVDKSGLERLMVILEEKARERGTVLVISHNSLTDWIRDSMTMVKGADQLSRLET